MRVFAVLAVLVAFTASASADPPGMTPTLPTPLDQLTRGDAAADRGLVFDSGLVLGRGDVDVSLRTVIKNGSDVGAAVGLGAGFQLSVDGLDSFGGRYESLGGAVRLRVAHGWRYSLSAQVGFHWASDQLDGDEAPFNGGYATLGGDLAVAISNSVLMSFGLGLMITDGDGGQGPSAPMVHVDLAIGRRMFRPLVEVGFVGQPLAFGGVRFATRHVSVDLGVGVAAFAFQGSTAVAAFAISVRP